MTPLARIVATSTLLLVTISRPSMADDTVSFARQVLPILSDKCFVCHGPDSNDDDQLRLDSFAAATTDLGEYKAIDPETLADSEILARIHSADDPMPPEDAEKQLSDAEREIISKWIKQGGKYERHWAFVPPTRDGKVDSIDHFIEENLRRSGLAFAEEASRNVLARRVALILTGLPPEPEQLAEFLSDSRPDAYQRYVETMLASPRYGEHQARYWLDAVRYGDTHGLHLDNRRGIYPYRDWVVRALNQNLPLDQFLTYQLAGDMLPNPSLEQLVATGFVRMNPTTSEGGAIPAEFQAKNNFDRTETIGTVLLGMTLTCARCHTHKYDPITQTEYYRLLAFFNNTAEKPMDGNSYTYGPVIKVPKDQQHWDEWSRLEAERDQLVETVLAATPPDVSLSGEDEKSWREGGPAERLSLMSKTDGPFAKTPFHQPATDLAKRISVAEAAFTTSLVARDLDSPRSTRVLKRGEYNTPIGIPLEPAVPAAMGSMKRETPRNRLGFAEWVTSRDHPLVARVLVNRIWQRTFGEALVRTPEDFGLQGQQATHPELLDWLAVELHESSWDLKHMLRLMVNSRTFKQKSNWRDGIDDPENKLWARGPSFRLDAEVIRDIGLWSSNLLDPHMGGEGVKPYQPAGMWFALAHPASNTKRYERDKGNLLYRRSLYVYWKRTSPHPMMTLFDAPDRESSCVRRSRTSTALQSLALFNETQRIEMGKKFAERLVESKSTTDDRIEMIFQLLACRSPSPAERTACEKLLSAMTDRYENNNSDAQSLLAVGESKCKETIDPTELAAWTQVAVTVLASDVALLAY